MRNYILFTSVFWVLITPYSFAWDLFSSPPPKAKPVVIPTQKRTEPPPVCLSRKQQSLQNRFTCPQANELYQSKMQWKTDSGWTGYQKSFAKGISHFMGAQWKGVGVGQIYCIYQPDDPSEFPIQLTSETLYSRPDYAMWENSPSKDVINCISGQNDPCDCQFSRYIEQKDDNIDDIIFNIEKE
ncbi:MAG: T4SS-associated protein EirA [Pseudomonadota bacterium]|nr:T4SS-associated protein EirA [Pseudomonadota bacterium]